MGSRLVPLRECARAGEKLVPGGPEDERTQSHETTQLLTPPKSEGVELAGGSAYLHAVGPEHHALNLVEPVEAPEADRHLAADQIGEAYH